MFKKILIGLLLIIGVFAIIVQLQPADFRIERSIIISGFPEPIFNQVNDFHKWEAWSPWAKLDPNAKNSYEGQPSGSGAIFKWAGNNEVGEGSMTIVESRPNELIKIKLEFLKPFKATNTAEFTFEDDGAEEGRKTTVTWVMTGKNNFMAKAFGLFVDCDKMIGTMFEKGLAQMKHIVENGK